MKRTFKVKYVFEGTVTVDCETKEEGKEIARTGLGGIIALNYCNSNIDNYEFDTNPAKVIIS